jgi:thiamine-phosphate pyrophosphorylase
LEGLRYRAYAAEQRLGLALGGGRAPQWRLCVLITEVLCRGKPWDSIARAAIAGGADCLQLREKDLPSRQLLTRALALVRLAREAGASSTPPVAPVRPAVIINDRPDIALLAGADGVHLGQEDLAVEDARRLAGSRLLIGISTANMDQARAAARAGADYCGIGPMFATTTKEKPVLSGPAYLREYLADPLTARVPHLAIGGITPQNIGELAAAGCRGVAVSAAVCGAREAASVCRQMVGVLMPN